jgi:hypothetical protein
MIVRALDSNGDWTFGHGRSNYKRANLAVAQAIQSRVTSFLGDCFFDLGAGIDWFNLLGGKNELAISLAVSAVILNTTDSDGNQVVTGVKKLSVNLDSNRSLQVSYQVVTVYSVLTETFQYDLGGGA